MLTENASATAEADIRALVENWRQAFLKRDLDTIMDNYTPDVVAFDAILKLQFKGVEAYREHWQACLDMCPGDLEFEIAELGVEAGDGIAFGHYLSRCGGSNDKGEVCASWMRATIALRRVGGRWKIAHEHFSAPFDPVSNKAMFDLVPE